MKNQSQDQMVFDDGFENQDEIRNQEVIIEESKLQQRLPAHKEEVKFILPPPQQIKSRSYSLQPDKATGWALKSQLPNPIPTIYNNKRLDELVLAMVSKNHQKIQLVYLGPRYENTFHAYNDKPFDFPYIHLKLPKSIKFKNRPFMGQNQNCSDCLEFDSIFQSANLDVAIKTSDNQYDLFLRVDSNTRGHFQWYNFKIKGAKRFEKYKLNICNFQKCQSLYSRGMKPYIYSSIKKVWQQGGKNITYSRRQIKYAKQFSANCKKMYSLSFQIDVQNQNQEFQIAYCVPYPYSTLLKLIKNLTQNHQKSLIIRQSNLCTTLGGLPIPLLTITEPEQILQKDNNQKCKSNKKCIIISARAHPGESNGSFMMEGFLKFICGDSGMAKKLRKQIIFKIVPMMNPDGVVLGNYRTGLSGKDFNRQYANPDRDIFPQVYAFKKLVTQNKMNFRSNFLMFLDFHGHSTKKNVFVYGPQFPITDKFYYESRVFPKLISNQNKMFRYHSCIFKISEFKVSTARAVLLRKINIPLSYTIQASNGSYHDSQSLASVPFLPKNWTDMGESIAISVYQYLELMLNTQKLKEQRIKNKRKSQSVTSKNDKFVIKKKQKQTQKSVLTTIQDAKVKRLYEEIIKQEAQRQLNKVSDDDISQGSSDKQDQKDDLSKDQLKALFDSIKNKNKIKKGKSRKNYGTIQDRLILQEKSQSQKSLKSLKQDRKAKKNEEGFSLAQNEEPIQNNKHNHYINRQVQFLEQIFITKEKQQHRKLNYFPNQNHKKISYTRNKSTAAAKIVNYAFETSIQVDFGGTLSRFPPQIKHKKDKIYDLFSQRSNQSAVIVNSNIVVVPIMDTIQRSREILRKNQTYNLRHQKIVNIRRQRFQPVGINTIRNQQNKKSGNLSTSSPKRIYNIN